MSEQTPTFFRIMLGALMPLAATVGVAAVGGLLVYLFWFGAGSLLDWFG